MKRIIAVAVLAAFTVPALALEIGPPYEQAQVDRQLPNVKDPVVTESASGGDSHPGIPGFRAGLPYSGLDVDRALPNVKDPIVAERRQYAGPATDGFSSSEAAGPWANDWNFIAPSE
jgi:hypothetical protein